MNGWFINRSLSNDEDENFGQITICDKCNEEYKFDCVTNYKMMILGELFIMDVPIRANA